MNRFAAVILYIYGLTILLSIAGQEVFGLVLHILAAVFLVQVWRHKADLRIICRTPLDKPVIYLFIVCTIGFFLNGVTAERFDYYSQARWIFLYYATVVCAYFYMRDQLKEDALRKLIIPMVCISALLGLYALPQVLYGTDWFHKVSKVVGDTAAVRRAVGTFSNPITFGNSIAMFASLLFALLMFDTAAKSKARVFYIVTFALTFLGLFLSQTRGAWFGFMCGLIVMSFYMNRRKIFAIYGAAVVAVFGLLSFSSEMGGRIMALFDYNRLMETQASRFYIWKSHWAMFLDNPIWGVSYNYNALVVEKYFKLLNVPEQYYQFSHAHDNVLQFLGGTGILGFLGYAWFTIAVFVLSVRFLKTIAPQDTFLRAFTIGFIGLQTTFFFSGITEATFRDSELRNQFLFFLALFIVLMKTYRPTQEAK